MENKLIVDFLNTNINNDGTYELPQFGTIRPNGDFKTSFTLEQMKFNKDWNWLMQVVDTIINLKNVYAQDRQKVFNSIQPNITTTYNEVVEFIKWYNEQNK